MVITYIFRQAFSTLHASLIVIGRFGVKSPFCLLRNFLIRLQLIHIKVTGVRTSDHQKAR
jgi:hypothetical protein